MVWLATKLRDRRKRLRRVCGLHQLFNALATSMKTEPMSLLIVLSVLMLLSAIKKSLKVRKDEREKSLINLSQQLITCTS